MCVCVAERDPSSASAFGAGARGKRSRATVEFRGPEALRITQTAKYELNFEYIKFRTVVLNDKPVSPARRILVIC